MNNTTSALIGLVILALLITRQLRARPMGRSVPLVLLGVLVVLGVAAMVFGVKSVTTHHPLSAGTLTIVCLSFVVAAAFGAVRALTMQVWRGPAGEAFCKGTMITVVLWLVSMAVHFGMDAWIDHSAKAGVLGFSTIYLYLAVTLGIQAVVVRRRAAAL
ncbi:hypothetical protein OG204_00120 [Streptomyces sp. NBC_01387]|uniref:hypothetical protein n=1 Tax=unclassified Streptomyces TaxID=2593676 RepID=UPI00224F713B|nr:MULTISPECIES: hypothetical protein [unclassified Streptomyces]WSS47243.1 hypothetical protein OG708_00400 [Streptomyces sp. NBC_01180]MCX4553178.1 hypothetical protein [Streptomyces sp. NBC_01500]MCX4554365.1 hypothetical protein [Streptomyces sp. NBC_01500]WSC24981.1 hypothetical protein OIE60_35585 [Streptomyces sp. NBC_01766]WSC25070.1 hypothetical protein OIE60_36140 [Streptomyces sp. NBC_01766]